MNVQEIQALLPHRYPFLLIDRVVEFDPNKSISGYKNVTVNEPFFQGHFPSQPVMPGVLILEALAQTCALLAYRSAGVDPKDFVTYLMSIDGAKFRRPVVPGDKLVLKAEVLRTKGQVWKCFAQATVDGQLASEAEILATMVERPKAGVP